jgi:hypothetical protein
MMHLFIGFDVLYSARGGLLENQRLHRSLKGIYIFNNFQISIFTRSVLILQIPQAPQSLRKSFACGVIIHFCVYFLV